MPTFLQRDHRLQVEVIAAALLTFTVIFCEVIAPGTKVEESFNMQAVHDILFSPTLDGFDHLQFSGVVPRTFAGAFVVAGVVTPLASFFPRHGGDAVVIAHAARIVLGLMFVASCWFAGRCLNEVAPTALGWRDVSAVKPSEQETKRADDSDDDEETEEEHRSVIRTASRPTFSFPVLSPCAWFLLATAGVFHLVFYASRMLPNTFALILLNVALGYLLQPSKQYRGLAVLGVTATVFRGDVFALIAPLGLILVATRRIELLRGLLVGAASVFVALCVTVPMDSYLWQKPFLRYWPEGVVLLFNTVDNQSHLWGTQPWHWYFSYALPRCFLGMIPFVLWASLAVGQLRHLTLATYAFVGLYSALPHKEVRFVLVAFPWLLAPLAVWLSRNGRPAPPASSLNQKSGVERVWRHSQRTTREHLRAAGMTAFLLLHVTAALVSAWVSSHNYPGTTALNSVHRHLDEAATAPAKQVFASATSSFRYNAAVVHLDAFAAMTGISRFSKKHFRLSSLVEAGLVDPFPKAGQHRPTATSGSHRPEVIVGYNKNPTWFNASRESRGGATEVHSAAPGSLLGDDYHDGFSMMVRRAEESFLHTYAGVYLQSDTVDSMERFDFKRLKVSTTRFLTIWEQPRWKRQARERNQQDIKKKSQVS